jgi:dethiobiotin synthetase
MKGLFITGTDSGVGKSVITGALARALFVQGMSVGVMKPIETGCRKRKGVLFPADGAYLKRAACSDDTLAQIVPYRYPHPLAPDVAARLAGNRLSLRRIVRRFETLGRRHDVTLVEGIGGLLVPLSPSCDLADLIVALNLPTLLVARSGLGTINHTLLTLRQGAERGVKFVGVILNRASHRMTLADRTNPAWLAEYLSADGRWPDRHRVGRLPVFLFPRLKADTDLPDTDLVESSYRKIVRLKAIPPSLQKRGDAGQAHEDRLITWLEKWLTRGSVNRK